MSLRRDMRVLTDGDLKQVYAGAQYEVAKCLSGGHVTLTSKYTKIAKAAEREIKRRRRNQI